MSVNKSNWKVKKINNNYDLVSRRTTTKKIPYFRLDWTADWTTELLWLAPGRMRACSQAILCTTVSLFSRAKSAFSKVFHWWVTRKRKYGSTKPFRSWRHELERFCVCLAILRWISTVAQNINKTTRNEFRLKQSDNKSRIDLAAIKSLTRSTGISFAFYFIMITVRTMTYCSLSVSA